MSDLTTLQKYIELESLAELSGQEIYEIIEDFKNKIHELENKRDDGHYKVSAKAWLEANVWDFNDTNDSGKSVVHLSPVELLELFTWFLEDVDLEPEPPEVG